MARELALCPGAVGLLSCAPSPRRGPEGVLAVALSRVRKVDTQNCVVEPPCSLLGPSLRRPEGTLFDLLC